MDQESIYEGSVREIYDTLKLVIDDYSMLQKFKEKAALLGKILSTTISRMKVSSINRVWSHWAFTRNLCQ